MSIIRGWISDRIEYFESIRERYGKKYYLDEIASVLAGLVLFCLIAKLSERAAKIGGWGNVTLFAIVTLLCLVARGPHFRDISSATSIILRVIAVLLGVYALLAGITYPTGISSRADHLLMASQFIGVAGAVGAGIVFRYPAFILVPCTAVLVQKAIASELFAVGISATDYIAVIEIGLFIGSGLCLLGPIRTRLPFTLGRIIAAADIQATTTLLFVAAVGVHFANYFYSGFTKVDLAGGPLLWVMENPTEVLTFNSWLSGFLPIGHLEGMSLAVADSAGQLRPLINISILLAQLGSVIFILRRRSMILITLFYDLTHVAIFLLSGIFFWKWIILNLGLVAAMRRLPRWVETPIPMILGVASVLLAPNFFHIARLGWYDTPALTRSEIYAVTKDGKEVRVPSNFFGTISITLGQHRLGRVAEGHYPTVTWGTTQSLKVFREALNNCSIEKDDRIAFKSDKDKIARIIQLTHAYAVQQAQIDGAYHYNEFPHHIWSNLWAYEDFASKSLDEIDHYIYRTISECVSLGEFGPTAREDFRDEFVVPVGKR